MRRRKQTAELIQGRAARRRTEGDYMGVLLGAERLEDWRAATSAAGGLGGAPGYGLRPAHRRAVPRRGVRMPTLPRDGPPLLARS
jgi:hypothetical protein